MMTRDTRRFGGLTVLLCDSITEIGPQDGGVFAVSGSHGGVNCAGYALRAPLAGVATMTPASARAARASPRCRSSRRAACRR